MITKHSNVYIGVLNNSNIKKIDLLNFNKKIVLFSNLNFDEMNEMDLLMFKNILENKISFIPSFGNIKSIKNYKKIYTLTLFVNWILTSPNSISLQMKNNSLLHLNNKDENWHKKYDGNLGYAISFNNIEKTLFYGYSAIINNSPDQILIKEFDGFFLNEYNINNNIL